DGAPRHGGTLPGVGTSTKPTEMRPVTKPDSPSRTKTGTCSRGPLRYLISCDTGSNAPRHAHSVPPDSSPIVRLFGVAIRPERRQIRGRAGELLCPVAA